MKYKVGDRVKVVKEGTHGEPTGALVTIVAVCEASKAQPYKCQTEKRGNWWFYENEIEPVLFTKSDLKDGDIVTLRNNKRKRVIGQNLISEEGSINLNCYINKLINVVDNSFDIIKVERCPERLETVFERKEEILNKAEKEYLSDVIRPFRNEVRGIIKEKLNDKNWISIDFKNDACMDFPNLDKKDDYKNMKIGKMYTLEELGL